MFDLTSSRRSRCHIVPYWPAAALLLCLTLPSCSGTKKIAKIATAATAPPARLLRQQSKQPLRLLPRQPDPKRPPPSQAFSNRLSPSSPWRPAHWS